MKHKTPILAILVVVLVLGATVGSAWSYFTDSATAEGTIAISVKPTSTIEEENSPGKKTIRIKNTSQAALEWVRVRAYATVALGANASGSNWSGSIDTWYEYGEPLPAGETTDPLDVTFTLKSKFDERNNPTGAHNGDEVNVVVVYETVPVSYDASGNPMPANWKD